MTKCVIAVALMYVILIVTWNNFKFYSLIPDCFNFFVALQVEIGLQFLCLFMH